MNQKSIIKLFCPELFSYNITNIIHIAYELYLNKKHNTEKTDFSLLSFPHGKTKERIFYVISPYIHS